MRVHRIDGFVKLVRGSLLGVVREGVARFGAVGVMWVVVCLVCQGSGVVVGVVDGVV